MFNPFQRLKVYVKTHPGQMEIINLKTSGALVKKTAQPFSSPRMLVAYFEVVKALCQQMVDEIGLAHKALRVVLQQMKSFNDPLSTSEKRILRDLGA